MPSKLNQPFRTPSPQLQASPKLSSPSLSTSLNDLPTQTSISANKSLSTHPDKLLLRICFNDDSGDKNVCVTIAVDISADFIKVREAAFRKLSVLCKLTETIDGYTLTTHHSRHEKLKLDAQAKVHPHIQDAMANGQVPLLYFVFSAQQGIVSKKSAGTKPTNRHLSMSLPAFFQHLNLDTCSALSPHDKKSQLPKDEQQNVRHRATTMSSSVIHSSEPKEKARSPSPPTSSPYTPLRVEIPKVDGFDEDVMSSVSTLGSGEVHPKPPTHEPLRSIGSRPLDPPRGDDAPAGQQGIPYYTVKFIVSPASCTHLQCTPGMTIANVIDKLVANFLRLSGIPFSPNHVNLVTVDNFPLPPLNTQLSNIPYFIHSLASHQEPVFKVKLAPDSNIPILINNEHHQIITSFPSKSPSREYLRGLDHDPIYSVIEAYLNNDPDMRSDHKTYNPSNLTIPTVTTTTAAPKSIKSTMSSISSTLIQNNNLSSSAPFHSHSGSALVPSYVRLELPRGIHSNVAVCVDTTIAFLLEKAAQKLHRVLGIPVPCSDLEVYPIETSQPQPPRSPFLNLDLGYISGPLLDTSQPTPNPLLPCTRISEITREFNPSKPLSFRIKCTSTILNPGKNASENAPGPLYFTFRRNTSSFATNSSEDSTEPILDIPIRLMLPRGVITNVRITRESTALHLLQRGVEKLHSMLGEDIDSLTCHVFSERPVGRDEVPLVMDDLLIHIPEIRDAFKGGRSALRDTIWFVVTGTTNDSVPPSPFIDTASLPVHTGASNNYVHSSDKRRISLNALLDRRPRVVTVKELHRDLFGIGDTSADTFKPHFASNSRSISVPASPISNSAPYQHFLKPKRHRHLSLCPKHCDEPHKMTIKIYLDTETAQIGDFSTEETVLAVKTSLLAPKLLTAHSSLQVGAYTLFYRHPQSQVLVQIADEECTIYQLGITCALRSLNSNEISLRAVPNIARSTSILSHTINLLLAPKPAPACSPSNSQPSPTISNPDHDGRLEILKNRLRNIQFVTSKHLACDRIEEHQLPSYLHSKVKPIKSRIPIRLHFPHEAITRTVFAGVNDLVSEFILYVVKKFSLAQWCRSIEDTKADQFSNNLMCRLRRRSHLERQSFPTTDESNTDADVDDSWQPIKPKHTAPPESVQAVADGLILQVVGRPYYLHPDQHLMDHYSIRYLLSRGEKINLLVTVPPESSMDRLRHFSRPLVWEPHLESSGIEHDSDIDIIRAVDQGDVFIDEACVPPDNHANLTLSVRDPGRIKLISLWDIVRTFRIQISRAERLLNIENIETIYAEASIAYGGKLFGVPVRTSFVRANPDPAWFTTIVFENLVCDLPKNSRLCVTVYGIPVPLNKGRISEVDRAVGHIPLGGVSILLIDDRGYLRQGMYATPMWENRVANIIGPCTSPSQGPLIQVRFDEFSHPVVYPDLADEDIIPEDVNYDDLMATRKEEIGDDKRELENLLQLNPLECMNDQDRQILWTHRFYLSSRPESLPIVLLSGRWDLLEDVLEFWRLLKMWKPISAETALSLLDGSYADDNVRAFAVRTLETLSDEVLGDYLMQLVQALYFEHRLDSALARFLLTRALLSPTLGHYFFWSIKAEMEKTAMIPLYNLLLETYLHGSSCNLKDMLEQQRLVDKLTDAALTVRQTRVQERKETLMHMLKWVPVVHGQRIPLDAELRVSELLIPKCKAMDSKKMPLWIVFKGATHRRVFHFETEVPRPFPDLHVIFKTGDDLRQDTLTLQMMRIMDRLWRAEGLDLRMTLYGCMSTGANQGFIEVVERSRTVSSIQIAHGGSYAAFKEDPIECWIRQHNPNEADYDKAVSNFTLSCAGYCVATYCLGIGDRHNDNIMCHEQGRLFHIDFGHFLGNVKRKFGIKRERVPFVLTPDFVHVMKKKNKDNYEFFISTAIKAYLIIRRNSRIFINLFLLMLSTGIPELQNVEDLSYLRTVFNFDMTEDDAGEEFKKLIRICNNYGWSTQLNWWVHNLAHSNGK